VIGHRMSKTALNQQTITMAEAFRHAGDNIAIVSVYPGYLATRLSTFRSRNDMKECISGVDGVIEGVTIEKTGKFVNWKGETMPW